MFCDHGLELLNAGHELLLDLCYRALLHLGVKNDEVADDAVVEVETPTPPPASERQVRKKREAVPPRDREEDHVQRTLREARERTAQKMQKVTEEMERLRAIRQQKNMRRRDGEL